MEEKNSTVHDLPAAGREDAGQSPDKKSKAHVFMTDDTKDIPSVSILRKHFPDTGSAWFPNMQAHNMGPAVLRPHIINKLLIKTCHSKS